MQQRDERKAILTGMLFAVLVGFAFVANKAALASGGLYDVLAYRFLFALAGLPLLLFIKKESLRVPRKDIPTLALICSTYVLFLFFQLIGLITCSTVIGAIFFATAPILIAVIAVPMLHERLHAIQLVAVLAGGAAVILMICAGEGAREITLVGGFFLALSTVSTALHSILTRMHRSKFTPTIITSWIVIAGAGFFTILLLYDHLRRGDMLSFFAPLGNAQFLLSAAYLGIGCILLSSLTITYTFRILPAAKAGVFSNISTVISILAGGIIQHEPLTILHIICVGVVIAAAFIINRRKEQLA